MKLIAFFAKLFGYLLNFLYEFVGNYGLAIILFSIIVKLLMLPISIKQQKTMQKSQKVNNEMQQIQFKYKNDPEKMNQEVMDLYKRENMSPFSGCFSAIIQIVLLFSVFYLVRSPLTYMKKVDPNVIEKLEVAVQENGNTSNYKEIAVINYINSLEGESQSSVSENEDEQEENVNDDDNNSSEKEEINLYEYKEQVYINMNFLGLDLSKVPTENLDDLKVLVIPILYVISSFISIKLSTKEMQKNSNQNKKITDGTEGEAKEEYDPMADANKSMSWLMPIMSISIACIAPLGLALYWLINNILMLLERVILKKLLSEKEEAKNNA